MLDDYAVPVREQAGFGIAVGLWLPAVALDEMQRDTAQRAGVRRALDARDLTCHTLNAFPFGDFHGSRVKEQVYLPDWSDPRRLDYTSACGRLLAELLPNVADFARRFPGSPPERMLRRGLADTDQRVREERPVTPALLFALLMYGPIGLRIEKAPPQLWHDTSTILDAFDHVARET